MKSSKAIKEKIEEIKDKIFKSPAQEEGVLFSYWLGYLRALEWMYTKSSLYEKDK